MNILIIGGTGVLSTAVVQEALSKGIKVTMINRGNRKERIPKSAELITADKDNKQLISHYLGNRSFDAICDFLCFNDSELEKSFNFYSNYTKQYFFISSAAVYNNSIPGACSEGHEKIQKLWPYSINKWNSELKLMELAQQSDTNYTIIRPEVTYDDTRIPYGIVPFYGYHWTLVERILHDKPIITWNGGENRCNMMRVEDFAVGMVGLIGNKEAYNEAFNICGDETPSFKEVMNTVGRIINHPVKFIDVNPNFYAQEDPAHCGELLGGRAIDAIIDNSKIKSIVPDFKQTIKLEEGLRRTLKAYQDHNYFKGIDWAYDGNIDRILLKWCKINKIEYHNKNFQFIDYQCNARLKDRLNYLTNRYADNQLIKLYFSADLRLKQYVLKLVKSIRYK